MIWKNETNLQWYIKEEVSSQLSDGKAPFCKNIKSSIVVAPHEDDDDDNDDDDFFTTMKEKTSNQKYVALRRSPKIRGKAQKLS